MPAEVEEAGVDIRGVGAKDLAPNLVELAFCRRPRQHGLVPRIRGENGALIAGNAAIRWYVLGRHDGAGFREREESRWVERRLGLFEQLSEMIRADKNMSQTGGQDARQC